MSSPFTWAWAHHKIERPAVFQFIIGQEWIVPVFPVQSHRLNVDVFTGKVFCCQGERLPVREAHYRPAHCRTANHIVIGGRTYWIKSHHREYIPGRHLAAVIVATQRIRLVRSEEHTSEL